MNGTIRLLSVALLGALAVLFACTSDKHGPKSGECDPGITGSCPTPPPSTPPPGETPSAGSIVSYGRYGLGDRDVFQLIDGVQGTFQWLTTNRVHKGWPAINRAGTLVYASTEGTCGSVSVMVKAPGGVATELLKVNGVCIIHDGESQTLGYLADQKTVAFLGLEATSATNQRLVVYTVNTETKETWRLALPAGMSLESINQLEATRLHPAGVEFEAKSLAICAGGNGLCLTLTDGVSQDRVVLVNAATRSVTTLLTASNTANPLVVDEKGGKRLYLGNNLVLGEDARYTGFSLYVQETTGGALRLIMQSGNPGLATATFCGQFICLVNWGNGENVVRWILETGAEQGQRIVEQVDRIYFIHEQR